MFFWRTGEIAAHGSSKSTEDRGPQPSFKPKLIEKRPYAEDASWVALKVNDGWLVAFDIGEWGGALVWFSSDGTAERKISDDQLNCFAQTPDGIFACGNTYSIAMFEIDRDRSRVWRIQEVCKLPYLKSRSVGWENTNFWSCLAFVSSSIRPPTVLLSCLMVFSRAH